MRALVDTNVLARQAQPPHALYPATRAALATLDRQRCRLCVVPQNLYEFWSLATRPATAYDGFGMTVPEAQAEVDRIIGLFEFLGDDPRGTFETWLRLVEVNDVKGKTAHDARLVAATRLHGLSHLLTFNVSDFARFSDIVLLDPCELARTP